MNLHAPIGVFDSGIGGLSIQRALCAALPQARFAYLADSGFAPYGERAPEHALERALWVTEYLRSRHQIQALVVACNTATAAAIDVLRKQHPDLPFIGVEPAVKPAAALTRTGRITVWATRGTLTSPRFQQLVQRLPTTVHVHAVACDGLAEAIEAYTASGNPDRVQRLCTHYLEQGGPYGTQAGASDLLVLGCTHYPLVSDHLQAALGTQVQLQDPGIAVARQLMRCLPAVQKDDAGSVTPPTHWMGCTGSSTALELAALRWLNWQLRPEDVRS